MTSCEARSPAGRRSCRNYVKRCLVVMLCCVLVFTMVPPPKAEATAGAATATLVASGAVAAAPVAATVGILCLAALGISFFQGYYQNDDSIFYGSRSYEVGLEFRDFMEGLDIPEHVASWWNNTVSYFEGKGGVRAGDTFTIPADVAEYARAWAAQKYDFSSGNLVFQDNGFFFNDSFFQYTTTKSVSGVETIDCLGTVFSIDSEFTFPNGSYSTIVPQDTRWHCRICDSVGNQLLSAYPYVIPSSTLGFTFVVKYVEYHKCLCLTFGALDSNNHLVFSFGFSQYYTSLSSLGLESVEVSSSLAGSDVLDVPVVEDVAVKVPALPTEKVGEMDIPIIGELVAEDVLVGEIDKPIDPPIEGEDTMVGDIALEDIAGMEGELGALFISKFPFSIPWDLFRAVKLLAAPPEAPYWEVDFLAPMEHRVGSWKGDTTIVIDMSEYEIVGIVCRWTSTLLFCAALIGATKRLIWTA